MTATVNGGLGAIMAFSGIDTANPIDAFSVNVAQGISGGSTAVTASNIVTVTANASAVMIGLAASSGSGLAGAWSGWSTGLTEIFEAQGTNTAGSATSVAAAWKTMAAPGASGTGSVTMAVSMRNGGLWVALRPAASAAANATNSMVSAAPASVLADGLSTSTVTVTLEDGAGAPVAGKTVTLASSRGATDTISAASGASDASGVVTFSVRSTTPGTSVYTATDVTDGVVVTQTASVVYLASAAKEILSFGANVIGSVAVIDTNAATVAWTVPYGTALTNLAPTYTVSAVSTGAPVSGTSRNFSAPQTYTITAQDGSTKGYTVTAGLAAPSAIKEILTFGTNYAGSSAVINTGAATVVWTVPFGTSPTNLAPAYSVSALATGAPASGVTRDFTTPQTYTVTAQDGSSKPYTITVVVTAGSPAKEFLTFGTNYAGSSAVINTNAATVAWTLPVGTSLASLAPAYTASPLASGSPASGTTRNFSTPQTYVVTAQDGSTKSYTVTATVLVGPQSYGIALATDVAQEFSPMNRSGHPIVTGLDNYPNSTAVGTPARRGLQPATLKSPWNVNVGQQTMMCSDCHNTDNATPAAQGPHGSAAPYMLRGANAANWPNVLLSAFNTSWCANCHNNFGGIHTRGDHTGQYCYACHIVVPHGGKMSRLIGDRDGTMPARYAWNNLTNSMQMRSFTKNSTNGYVEGNCQAACTTTHGTAAGENW